MNRPPDPLVYDTVSNPGPRDVRVVVVHDESAHPFVDTTGDDWLMAVPHLILREVVVGCLLVAFLAGLAYFFNAPLLDIADPGLTPNPSKAPWYFLGLQELLHYYPPFISGIVIPGLVVVSLVVIPYFPINVRREPFLTGRHFRRHLAGLWGACVVSCALFYVTSAAGPVWPLIGSTLAVTLFASLPAVLGRERGFGHAIATRSLPMWIFTWFFLSATVLTIIGTLFRGPGWSFVLPWKVGIYG